MFWNRHTEARTHWHAVGRRDHWNIDGGPLLALMKNHPPINVSSFQMHHLPIFNRWGNSLEKHKHQGKWVSPQYLLPSAYKQEGAWGDFQTEREEPSGRGSSVLHRIRLQNDFLHSLCLNKLRVVNCMYDGFTAKFTRPGIVYCNNLLNVILRFTCHLLSWHPLTKSSRGVYWLIK